FAVNTPYPAVPPPGSLHGTTAKPVTATVTTSVTLTLHGPFTQAHGTLDPEPDGVLSASSVTTGRGRHSPTGAPSPQTWSTTAASRRPAPLTSAGTTPRPRARAWRPVRQPARGRRHGHTGRNSLGH